jgi:hypothetical protein
MREKSHAGELRQVKEKCGGLPPEFIAAKSA